MPYYIKRGEIPPKRHIQHRGSEGGLRYEELISREGFSNIYSNAYHIYPPTRIKKVGSFKPVNQVPATDSTHRHRHLETFKFKPFGDWISGRRMLAYNSDVVMYTIFPEKNVDFFYRNGNADEVIFVHSGRGMLKSQFGDLPFEDGDYIIIPGGTLHQLKYESDDTRLLVIESYGPVEPPKRYLNKFGQLLEHAPYCERDIIVPEFSGPVDQTGDFKILLKLRSGIQEFTLAHHPFDLVGWDGFYYPWILNISDFMPIVGKLHQPPPVHQTFEGPGFVICSFVPRLFDFHELSIPAPYNHSNVDSDEVLYYVEGDFMSRKGVSQGSVTIHPAGLPHGPHPGRYEESIGKKKTEELAVMLDTFKPLIMSKEADEIDDPAYPLSWLEE
ncbi:MAG: homogentisate 1,2-dioxygenase [Calditrichaceae bacterium]